MKHSKLPWRACHEGKCVCGQIWSQPDDHPVATVIVGKWGDDFPTIKLEGGSLDRKAVAVMEQITYGKIHKEISEANAAFIVKACNSHDDLLEAVASLLNIDNYDLRKAIIDAAIAKAGKK